MNIIPQKPIYALLKKIIMLLSTLVSKYESNMPIQVTTSNTVYGATQNGAWTVGINSWTASGLVGTYDALPTTDTYGIQIAHYQRFSTVRTIA